MINIASDILCSFFAKIELDAIVLLCKIRGMADQGKQRRFMIKKTYLGKIIALLAAMTIVTTMTGCSSDDVNDMIQSFTGESDYEISVNNSDLEASFSKYNEDSESDSDENTNDGSGTENSYNNQKIDDADASDTDTASTDTSRQSSTGTSSTGILTSTEDINLHDIDGAGTNYEFTYNGETYSAVYTTDNWRIYNSYKIQDIGDIAIICQALIDIHPIHGSDMESYRTVEDMAYEWLQHNLAYEFLPDDDPLKSHARDVDLDPKDQNKSFEEIYKDRTGKEFDITDYLN